jgi:hypothetical protein
LGESVPMAFDLNPLYSSNDDAFLYCYTTATGLYGVCVNEEGAAESKEVINWLNSDISPNLMGSMVLLGKDKVFCSVQEPYIGGTMTAIWRRVPADEIVKKPLITIGYANGGNFGSDAHEYALEFNKASDEYRVQIIDYQAVSGGLYGEELKLFINTQFAAGDIPDVLLLNEYELLGKDYENKNLFLDLYTYLDNDDTFSRDSFLKSALRAGEVDGALQRLIYSFKAETLDGKAETFRGMRGWGISDYLDVAENLSDGVKIIQDETRKNVYDTIIVHGMNEFIDFEKGACSFDGDLFMRLLNYLASLPSESDRQYTEKGQWKELREGTTLIDPVTLQAAIYYTAERVIFGTDELEFVGFPGGGEKINPAMTYTISAQSEKEKQDGAWAFIKFVFEREYRPSFFTPDRFLSTYTEYNKMREQEMKRFYNVLPERGYGWSLYEMTEADLMGGTQVTISQDDSDEVRAYLESIVPLPTIDKKVYEIIGEEMQYFFADAKTAEETAKIIQSRVSIYLSERE